MQEPRAGRPRAESVTRRDRNNDDPFFRYAGRFDRPLGDVPAALRSSRAAPAEIARTLGLPAAAVEGPASFFADVSAPRGDRHVRVCSAAACFAATGGAHVAEVEAALGVVAGTASADGAVSLQAVRCLGYCFAGPAALDGDDPCSGADLAAQVIGSSPRTDPPIPVFCDSPVPVVTAGLLGASRPWSVWPGVAASAAPQDVLPWVPPQNWRGRGGGGFRAAAKWRAALEHPAPRVVVANGDEGDPGSYADRLLMEQDPHRVLEGLALACFAVGATTGIVFVRSEYPRAAVRLRNALHEARRTGHLGPDAAGSGFRLEVRVLEGAG
jgi:NADH-quinone oxidoreductase subunit F